jgi:hypothetical protein
MTAMLAPRYLLPILLLIGSNVFMTLAWYGHLRFKQGNASRLMCPEGRFPASKIGKRLGSSAARFAARRVAALARNNASWGTAEAARPWKVALVGPAGISP